VGTTGAGKSATANTICGGDYFKSGVSAKSMTKICQQKKVTRLVFDISVIDTPGIFDSEADHEAIEREIKRCVHLGAPGLHAILYIMKIDRIREDDIKAIQTFLKFFQKEMENRLIVVFTHADILSPRNRLAFRKYLNEAPVYVRDLLKTRKCPVVLFNNTADLENKTCQAMQILSIIEKQKASNNLAFYIDAKFQEAEEEIKKKEDEIQKRLSEKYSALTKEIKEIKIDLKENRPIENETEEIKTEKVGSEEIASTIKIKKISEMKNTEILKIREMSIIERLEELQTIRKKYEKLLRNVRKDIRDEIQSNDDTR
jgi:hypothetical protein